MKRNLQILILMVVLNIIFGCLASVAAQKVGGFTKISKTDEVALEAADFAVEAKSKKDETTFTLVSLDKAERQTVAGTNYRLCLSIKDVDENEKTVLVVVYRNLQKVFSLTSWKEEECSDDED